MRILYKLKWLYKAWRMRRNMMALLKTGDVRELKEVAAEFRAIGEKFDLEHVTEFADELDRQAERVVLRRISL